MTDHNMRKWEAIVFGIVLTITIVAGVLNAQWGSYGWYAQINVNAPSNVEVEVYDNYGQYAYITGSGSASLGPIHSWSTTVYAQVVNGPPGCTV